jgi:hypothetical protein
VAIFAVASLIFFPYARDIWAVFFGLFGVVILLVAVIRLFQVFGFLRAGWSPEYWKRAHGSGWGYTLLGALVGLGLIALAYFLSERVGNIFLPIAEILSHGL